MDEPLVDMLRCGRRNADRDDAFVIDVSSSLSYTWGPFSN